MKVFLLWAALLTALPAQAATRFALLIGNNVGDLQDGALRWAEQDALRLRDLLTELGGVAKGRSILLQGASVKELRSTLARLHGQVEESKRHGYRSELFIFYSGHGDADSLHLGSERIALSEFRSLANAIPADAIVTIIDACRAGSLRSGRGKGAVHGPAFDISLARETGPLGRVLITSAGLDEIAQESDELRGSFFSHHMLSGLRGAADTDNDGNVTLAELYRYAYFHTLTSSHGETAAVQHPAIEMTLEGEGEIVLSELKRSASTLELPEGLGGDFLVVDDRNGHVLAEVRKPVAETRKIAVPAGRYRIQLRHEGRIYAGEVALEWGGLVKISEDMLAQQPITVAMIKGRSLNPSSWAFGSAGRVGTPSVLQSGFAYGGMLNVEHSFSDAPLLLLAHLSVTQTDSDGDYWHTRHLETRLGLGLGYALFLGPARLTFSVSMGGLYIDENRRRLDEERIQNIFDVDTRAYSETLGPFLSPGLSLRLPLYDSWALSLGVEIQAALVYFDGEWSPAYALLGHSGLEYIF